MDLTYISFLLFAGFSSLRMVSYLPQIYRVAVDGSGASAISYSTWGLWVGANITTALYAFNNLGDPYLGWVSLVYAGCCIAVILLTMAKRRRYRSAAMDGTGARTRAPRWLRPAAGVALAGIAAVGIGFGAGWAFPNVSRPLLPGPAAAHLGVESAVADTPFGDEVWTDPRKTTERPRRAPTPSRQARPASLPETQFEARARPEPRKGTARPGNTP
jgi:hypothetical protein